MSEERLEEAMDWFLRLNEPSRSKADERDFTIWMNVSAENRDAWKKACRTWEVMGAAMPALPSQDLASQYLASQSQTSQQVLPSRADRRRVSGRGRAVAGRRAVIATGVTAIAACLIAVIAAPSILTRYEADHVTATGENRRITLADGSTVDMGAASAIAVDFSGKQREVHLLSGEAYFDVRPDASRPFVVKTGELDVTVVGTAFDVNVTPDSETVQLAHGAISLSAAKSGEAIRLVPGDTVTLDKGNGHLVRAKTEIESIASWRDRKLFVQNVPISAVVAELQRYHPSWITVASGDLGQRRITGLYDLSDPDRALEALVSPYGGKVHHVSPYLRVLALF